MDFPGYIRESGKANAGVLIVPAKDPPGNDPIHTQMAVFRAIENGLSMVRQADHGLSIAVDCFGRVIASNDHFEGNEHIMLADLPSKGVQTVNSKIGDLFSWICVFFLGLLVFETAKSSPIVRSQRGIKR